MLTRILAAVLLIIAQMPIPSMVMADGEVEAFRAAYGRYQTAIEANDLETASEAATEALELGRVVLPADSASLLALYLNHGDLLIDLGQYSEAVAVLDGAVADFSEHYGKKDERLIFALWALAEANGGAGEHDIAVAQLTRLGGMVRKANGRDSRVFADLQQLLGQESYLSRTHYKKARRPLDDAYEIYGSLYGASVYQTGLAALWLGKAELLEKRTRSRAEKHFLEALQIFEETTPTGHQLRLAARDLLVHVYQETERSELATEHLVAIALMTPNKEIDGDWPQYKQSTEYPRAAALLEKEGWVLLEFTVSAEGTVINPAVVSSEGGEDFELAAMDAIRGYRYAPAVLDGQVVATGGVRHKVTFELADLLSPDQRDAPRRGLPQSRPTQY